MRVFVDPNICQRHGQCEYFAPEVFQLNEDSELEYKPEVAEDVRDSVEEAARGCPTQAIRIEQ
jgi:ferredoxin